jgi:cell division protein FtsB
MQRQRRQQFNTINAASLARWIVITGFLALTGLIYVYLTVQFYHLGDRKKALEKEIANLRAENEVASVQIAALTSRSALQRRLKEGYLKMLPISEQNIVRMNPPGSAPQEDAIQPVANQRAGR